MILARQVSKTYANGTLALDGVSLSVAAGEMVAILGPSGAGKTTFLKLLNGTLRPTSGSLEVLDTPLNDINGKGLRQLRRAIAYIPQSTHVVPRLSVLHNVLMGELGVMGTLTSLRQLFYPSRGSLKRVVEALTQVGLQEKAFERGERLSGGEQQRVALARALLQKPRVIVADEPIASLDIVSARQALVMLRGLSAERGTTVVVSLHQVGFALEHAPRIVGLAQGRVVFDGPPTGLDVGAIYPPQEETVGSAAASRPGIGTGGQTAS